MIDTHKALVRRDLASQTAEKIVSHPAFPFHGEWPRAMIVIIENALKEWESKQ